MKFTNIKWIFTDLKFQIKILKIHRKNNSLFLVCLNSGKRGRIVRSVVVGIWRISNKKGKKEKSKIRLTKWNEISHLLCGINESALISRLNLGGHFFSCGSEKFKFHVKHFEKKGTRIVDIKDTKLMNSIVGKINHSEKYFIVPRVRFQKDVSIWKKQIMIIFICVKDVTSQEVNFQ